MNFKSLTLFAALAAVTSAPVDAGVIKRKIVRTTTVVTTTYYPAPPPQIYVKPVHIVRYQRVPVYYPILVQRFRMVQPVYFSSPAYYRRSFYAAYQPSFRHFGSGKKMARW